jgi:hypothetical protein
VRWPPHSNSLPPSLDAATAVDGPGTGWDLHELRHSGLTHLGESGASLLELMAKSRHRKAENLRRYFKPSPQAMRNLTSLLGPGTDRQHLNSPAPQPQPKKTPSTSSYVELRWIFGDYYRNPCIDDADGEVTVFVVAKRSDAYR